MGLKQLKISKFLSKLYDLLNDKNYNDDINWNKNTQRIWASVRKKGLAFRSIFMVILLYCWVYRCAERTDFRYSIGVMPCSFRKVRVK